MGRTMYKLMYINIYRKLVQTDVKSPHDSNHYYLMFYKLEHITLNRHNCQYALDIIYDIVLKKQFKFKFIKLIHKRVRVGLLFICG